MKITLGEKEYDLEKALPVTLGDIRRLKREYNIKLADLAAMDIDTVAMVFLMLCQKLDPGISEALIDLVPLSRLTDVADFLRTAAEPQTDHPTSG